MALIRGYMAASVDGYIADSEGGVSWLDPFNAVDCGYTQFTQTIRTVVLGRKTYEQVCGFSSDWVYTGKRAVVVTSNTLTDPPPDVSAWTQGLADLVQYLRALDDGDVWIVGGAQLQSAILKLGAMDRLELFVIPVLLGTGIPLFPRSEQYTALSLYGIDQFDKGIVKLDYRFNQPSACA